jgi:hypothetical protein
LIHETILYSPFQAWPPWVLPFGAWLTLAACGRRLVAAGLYVRRRLSPPAASPPSAPFAAYPLGSPHCLPNCIPHRVPECYFGTFPSSGRAGASPKDGLFRGRQGQRAPILSQPNSSSPRTNLPFDLDNCPLLGVSLLPMWPDSPVRPRSLDSGQTARQQLQRRTLTFSRPVRAMPPPAYRPLPLFFPPRPPFSPGWLSDSPARSCHRTSRRVGVRACVCVCVYFPLLTSPLSSSLPSPPPPCFRSWGGLRLESTLGSMIAVDVCRLIAESQIQRGVANESLNYCQDTGEASPPLSRFQLSVLSV